MKKLFTQLFALVIIGTAFTSCMKNDDTDYEAENIKIEERIDSILNEDKRRIERFMNENGNFNLVEDSININYNYIAKKSKRGIWYEVVKSASEESEKAYQYSLNNSGTDLTYPKVKLKYTAKLLDGTVVQEDEEGSIYDLGVRSTNIIKTIWDYSFFPYSIKFNGRDIKIAGLTKNGLKEGSILKVITPSLWAYGDKEVTVNGKKIPANSSLVYEFEVLSIEK